MKTFFWKKFSQYLLIGLSTMFLLAGGQQMMLGNVLQRGPNPVLADEDDCAVNPDVLGCPNPGEVIGDEPLPPEPVQPAPAPAPAQPAPQPVPVLVCSPNQWYKQCTGRCVNGCGERQARLCNPDGTGYDQDFGECAEECAYACPPAPAQPVPAQPAPAQPAPAPAPSTITMCNGQVKTWDQIDSELRVAGYPGPYDHSQAEIDAYNRAACPSGAPAPVPAQPGPAPAPSCPADQIINTIERCVGNQICKFNIHHNADCSTYEGHAYGCQNSSQCGFTPPPPSSYSACGKTGTVWTAGGYRELHPPDCAPNQFLVVEGSSDSLLPTCRAIPSGNTKTADGCGYTAVSVQPAPPVCIPDGSCSAAAPACGTTTTGVDNCRRPCTRQGAACPTPAGNPVCTISQSASSGYSPLAVNFVGNAQAGGSRAISSYSWDLDGNGSYTDASGQSVSKTYTSSSNISLQVTDSAGSIGYCSASIAILSQPAGGQISCPSGTTLVGGVCEMTVRLAAVSECPSGYTKRVEGNTITCIAPAPTVITFGNVGVGGTVYTAGVSYTQLPKTGLPVLVWSALAFIPAGFRMRRFSKVKKELENHPSYIFDTRQFRSGS